ISVPTGIVFLSALGTIWMGRIHFKVPMLWVFGFLWAFVIGGITGVYYWFPKITGRMYDERLGRLHFWWFTIAFNLTFLPMFWLGIEGMRRRVADYPPELGAVNLFVSVMAVNIALSVAVFVFNMVRSWRRGPRAVANPWDAQTLEWMCTSPPPIENFAHIPRVTGTPYQYGSPPMAVPSGEPIPATGHPQP
ncbi:MAG TPA: cbb3-type cytochrome c oxidase subunit I, partial [Candidatus Limnocylindria bacterium]